MRVKRKQRKRGGTMKGKVLHIPQKPGMEAKRHRRKKCPDEYMELPPPPKLYEFDPVIFEEMKEAGGFFLFGIRRVEKQGPHLEALCRLACINAPGMTRTCGTWIRKLVCLSHMPVMLDT